MHIVHIHMAMVAMRIAFNIVLFLYRTSKEIVKHKPKLAAIGMTW